MFGPAGDNALHELQGAGVVAIEILCQGKVAFGLPVGWFIGREALGESQAALEIGAHGILASRQEFLHGSAAGDGDDQQMP